MATSSTDVDIVYTAFRDREENSYFTLTCKGCWWSCYDQDKWVAMHQGFLFLKVGKKHSRMPFNSNSVWIKTLWFIFNKKKVEIYE